MTNEILRTLLVALLVVPVVGAVIAAALGPGRPSAVRNVSLATALLGLLLAILLAANYLPLAESRGASTGPPTFRPEIVPGASDDQPHATTWTVLPVGRGAVQFYLGLDGLNVWLVLLTSLLMVPAVLVSWHAIGERANEYYAWLLALGAGMTGVFLAFDILLFYVFFELTLVPLFFLIGIWGGSQRQYAARKFFIYTLAGSVVTLLGVLAVVLTVHARTGELTFSIPRLVELVGMQLALPGREDREFWHRFQIGVFLAISLGFAIKVPLVPVHTWLPLAHVEAPTAGSVLLAGVLLKIGSYGFLRLCLPLAPDAALLLGAPLVGTLAVVGILYGAFCSLAQDDVKKLIAYSSVSHLGFCMLGMFALNHAGLAGSLLQMINHGLSTGVLFLLVGMLYERYHTRKMEDYGGMAAKLKLLGFFMVLACMSSAGLPGLNGFVGEALVFFGMFGQSGAPVSGRTLAVLGSLGIVLGAWYLLTMLRRVFFGALKEPAHEGHGPIHDLNGRELVALLPLAVLFVLLGVYPQPVLDASKRDLEVIATIADGARQRGAVPAPGQARAENVP